MDYMDPNVLCPQKADRFSLSLFFGLNELISALPWAINKNTCKSWT